MQHFPEFQNAQDIDGYIELIEQLLNFKPERLMRIAFDVYDFNQDKSICELDTYTTLQNFNDDDEVFVAAFSYDLCILGRRLDEKRKELGVTDFAEFLKLQAIQRKLRAKGATLDQKVLAQLQ